MTGEQNRARQDRARNDRPIRSCTWSRNSVDHGIEMPDVRSANGKSPTGTVFLEAYHKGGNIPSKSATTAAVSTRIALPRRRAMAA